MPFTDAFKKQADKFHAHLDECKQCEEHPFELCSTGQKLMKELGESLGQGKGHDESLPDQG